MNRAVLFVIISLIIPSTTLAGEIRGAITEGGKSIGAGVPVEVRCGGKAYPPVTTDKYGSYRLFVQEKGTCTLQLNYQNQTVTRDIESFEDSVRYDLVVEKQGGQSTLRRK